MNKPGLWDKLLHLQKQDILSFADIEFSRFLKKVDDEVSDEVLLAACLTSYHFRQGNVCLLLEEVAGRPLFSEANGNIDMAGFELTHWLDKLHASPVVGLPGDYKPLILDQANRLYLHKLWHYEKGLAGSIAKLSKASNPFINELLLSDSLSRLFDRQPGETDWQEVAAIAAVYNRFTVISGGPGTGKTSTVIRILALLLEQANEEGTIPSIALAAPTGKAAARLKDSILAIRDSLPVGDEIRQLIPGETTTLHQLLGARRYSSSYRYNRENPLPYDLVIVDEASMVDQALMGKLMDALLDETRVILLGDKDQLASVEAGSVLGDLCATDENRLSETFVNKLRQYSIDIPSGNVTVDKQILTDHIILLTRSYRFEGDSGIARLAEAVNKGNDEDVLHILDSDQYPEVGFLRSSESESFGRKLEQIVIDYFEEVINAPSYEEALDAYNSFRILAAHRRGPWGVEYLNQVIEHILNSNGFISGYQTWYPGKPVIINENDYSLNLYNGDTGICLRDDNGDLKVYVSHRDTVREISPARLPDHSLAYALTVHKSQGSEFNKVILILPDQPSRILTRELLYTAITRAREEVVIGGRPEVLCEGVKARLKRTSGLKDQLWGEGPD